MTPEFEAMARYMTVKLPPHIQATLDEYYRRFVEYEKSDLYQNVLAFGRQLQESAAENRRLLRDAVLKERQNDWESYG